MRRCLNQGVVIGHLLDMLVDPPHESPILPEAQGLHPLGALAHTHVRQEEGEALDGRIDQDMKMSTPAEPSMNL
jgi:hypothetical protein